MVQAPGFIRGINPFSTIENPQAPAFIRGVNLKSQISNLKSIDGRVGRLADDGLKLTRGRTGGPAVARVRPRRVYMAGYLIVTSSEGDGVGPRKLQENSSSKPVNFTRSPQSGTVRTSLGLSLYND